MEQLAAACAAGEAATPPFDGARLLAEDVRRLAPIDPASTVPDATGRFPFREGPATSIECRDVEPQVARLRRFRAPDRTLKHEEVDPQIDAVVKAMEQKLHAEIRK